MKNPNDKTLEGEILLVDPAKGFGIITFENSEVNPADNTLYFKLKDLAPDTAITDLTVGTRVSLNLAMSEFGPHASDVSKIAPTTTAEKQDKTVICVERLASSKPIKEKVLENRIYDEDRIIDKAEALKYLVLAAVSRGVNLDSLILSEVWTDKNGAIVGLEVKSTDEKTGDDILFTYVTKNSDWVDDVTHIYVGHWEKDSMMSHSDARLAKYVGGQWVLFDNSKPKGEEWVAQT